MLYSRASYMEVDGKKKLIWSSDAATLQGSQDKHQLTGLVASTKPQGDSKDSGKEETETCFFTTAVSPITYSMIAKIFVNVYPSVKYATLASFPSDVRELYTTYKSRYSAVTHTSDFTMHKTAAWQPKLKLDVSRLSANGRFFLETNPHWQNQHVILVACKLDTKNRNPDFWGTANL